ncbi:hypothetical protein LJC46_06925 [Desulfovibrio sp. OttesenSCG-928-G15]|nr:hypothetical protein [Desulfovibrio sp. OttesenSCG-928-G15]
MNVSCAKNTHPIHSAGRQKTPPDRRIAAPSWVMPASVAENCRFLSGKVDEVALLFFDTGSSLAYGENELDLPLEELALSCHVHLPLDLPWDNPVMCAGICLKLLHKTRHLADRTNTGKRPHCRAVLHPPPHEPDRPKLAAQRLAAFAGAFRAQGGSTSLLYLENIRENDLLAICRPAAQLGFGFCLDAGHMLAYAQEHILESPDLLERCAIVHLSAPGKQGQHETTGKDGHAPLNQLHEKEQDACRKLVRSVPAGAVIVLEIFSWEGVAASMPVLATWLLPFSEP